MIILTPKPITKLIGSRGRRIALTNDRQKDIVEQQAEVDGRHQQEPGVLRLHRARLRPRGDSSRANSPTPAAARQKPAASGSLVAPRRTRRGRDTRTPHWKPIGSRLDLYMAPGRGRMRPDRSFHESLRFSICRALIGPRQPPAHGPEAMPAPLSERHTCPAKFRGADWPRVKLTRKIRAAKDPPLPGAARARILGRLKESITPLTASRIIHLRQR